MHNQFCTLALATLTLASGACKPQRLTNAECEPQCHRGCGFDDGCGGTCGCTGALACNALGQCVAEETCTDTCESFTCGEICGASCGTCQSDQACLGGQCTGARSEGCAECSLSLLVTGQQGLADGGTEVELAVDYQPGEDEPRPRVADLRLVSNRDLNVESVEAGPALLDVGKDLYRSPRTGKAYKQPRANLARFLALSIDNVERFGQGRLFTTKVRFLADSATFRIERRDQVFAPADANNAVQASSFDGQVVVIP